MLRSIKKILKTIKNNKKLKDNQNNSQNNSTVELFQPRLKMWDYFEYIIGNNNSIARQHHDYYIKKVLPELQGKVLEIGATPTRNYSSLAINAKEYVKSNLFVQNKSIVKIDATNIDMPDNSFDGIICLSVLEHIEDFRAVISEFYRVLSQGGKLVLAVPFMFCYHGAPDDYYRFSESALKHLLKDFSNVKISAIGNYWHNVAHVLQGANWSKNNQIGYSPWYLRLLGLPFYIRGSFNKKSDSFALLYCVIAEK